MEYIQRRKTYIVRIVSEEYAVDNLYIDDEGGYVYLSELDFENNRHFPVFENIEISSLGTVQTLYENEYKTLGDFFAYEFNPIDDPEYFI